ncbi:MAG: thiamine phosphate synthase [Nitrospirota bacterium]
MFPLYFVTDPVLERPGSLPLSIFNVVEQAIAGGAQLIQYRDKVNSRNRLYENAKELREITLRHGVTLIINDQTDLALAVLADGVHLGQDDLPIFAARKLLGKSAIIGISTHSVEEAIRAESDGADYIGFGPIFRTVTKVDVKMPVGMHAIADVKKQVQIPLYAIGGIKKSHLPDLFSAGADGVVAISALAGDITANVADWIETIQSIKKHPVLRTPL